MTNKTKAFEKILMEAIDEALNSLGESAKQSIYFHLEKKFKISRKDIPSRIEEFEEGLKKIFGLGAHFMEILIMKSLFEKIGKPLDWNQNKELMFTEYVAAAKQSFLRGKKEVKEVEA